MIYYVRIAYNKLVCWRLSSVYLLKGKTEQKDAWNK